MTNAVLFQNANVIDGAGRAPFAASVLVSDGKIEAVGPEADARANHLARRIDRLDVAGRTLMPGLIDTHCHLAFDDAASNSEIFFQRRNALSALVAAYNAKKLLRAGVTGLLDPDSTFENMIDLRDAIEANVAEGPRMSCGSYALITAVGGTAGRLINDTGITGYYMAVRSKDEIVAEVRRQIKAGADWIKVHVTGVIPRLSHLGELCVWTDEELELITGTAHDLGTPVMGHCRGAGATYKAAKAGFDLIFHATGMDDRALEIIADKKIPISPALTFQANMVDFGERLGTDASLISLFEREITDSIETMQKAYKAGVPLLCGSESGFSMVPYGHWHYREMEVFVRYFGLTNLQAIECGTRNGAIGLKMPGKVGEIAPGMLADLIIVDGDPSKDVRILGEPGRIQQVMVNGDFKDISEPKTRRNIPGWRHAGMGLQLTREMAMSDGRLPAGSLHVEELH
ncbi:amidohydrolase family protein [uncultured Alsobacter sp.]|uniref:metal-dependent hydrolase family protein n=1 Tax=uncultured Alsobacter sp. TaxID=1748258 RepID=UPI0025D4C1DE|nr:amidohydrolase family protein [uncultured Alsobacter sp.]